MRQRVFDKDLESEGEYFPRIWLRYVDEIVDTVFFDTITCNIDLFPDKLNNRLESIEFTYEKVKNGRLTLTDALVIRNNILEDNVCGKETSTFRYIPSDSHHFVQFKMAASLNSLVQIDFAHFPERETYENDLKFITDVANGISFQPNFLNKLNRKFNYKRTLESSTFHKHLVSLLVTSFACVSFRTKYLKKIFEEFVQSVDC